MQYSLAALALAAAVNAIPTPQEATGAPAECSPSYSGTFEISVVNTTESKRSLEERQGALTLTLADGVLKDSQGRIGYIAANNQFQFDNPVQDGTIYASGWAVCPDGTLVLGKDSVFQQCLSGTFYNLYDENPAAQCNSVKIYVIGASTGTAPPASQSGDGQPVESQQPDGQITGTPAPAPPVTQIGDGQPQAPISQIGDGQIQAPVTQIGDGQIQAPTGAPVTQIGDGQVQAPPSATVVSQISDGQPQEPTGVVSQISDGQPQQPTGVVSQISDGQPQQPTGVVSQISDGQPQQPTGVVSQISDGQPQEPTGVVTQITDGQIQAPVTQIGDGQIQAPTGAPVTQIGDGQIQAPVTQIGDGQIQAPTGAPVTQIGDGQIQAPTNGSVASPTPQPYTGNAVAMSSSVFGLFAGIIAVALL